MNASGIKLFLEIYGIGRIILGIAELVGAFAGYFFLEFIVQYPEYVGGVIFDRDVLVMAYLAVTLRGIFHVLAGIGIARLQIWGKWVLQYGWVLMTIIAYGMLHLLFDQWREEGQITKLAEIIAWPKVFVYVLWMGFDLVGVGNLIDRINANQNVDSIEDRIGLSKVFTVIGVAVFSFSLLLFLGKPIHQGFHKGFYKSSGVRESASSKAKKSKVLESVSSKGKEIIEEKPPVEDVEKEIPPVFLQKKEEEKEGAYVDGVFKTTAVNLEKDIEKPQAQKQPIESIKEGSVESGIPYANMIGVIASVCLVLGLLMQVWDGMNPGGSKLMLLSGYGLMGIGFLLWAIFGLGLKNQVLFIGNALSAIFCVIIALMRYKE